MLQVGHHPTFISFFFLFFAPHATPGVASKKNVAMYLYVVPIQVVYDTCVTYLYLYVTEISYGYVICTCKRTFSSRWCNIVLVNNNQTVYKILTIEREIGEWRDFFLGFYECVGAAAEH